ncbi:hypothetical protein D3C74_350860 [compost metagenome]
MRDSVVPSSRTICGKAERYRSIVSGPIAVSADRSSTKPTVMRVPRVGTEADGADGADRWETASEVDDAGGGVAMTAATLAAGPLFPDGVRRPVAETGRSRRVRGAPRPAGGQPSARASRQATHCSTSERS